MSLFEKIGVTLGGSLLLGMVLRSLVYAATIRDVVWLVGGAVIIGLILGWPYVVARLSTRQEGLLVFVFIGIGMLLRRVSVDPLPFDRNTIAIYTVAFLYGLIHLIDPDIQPFRDRCLERW